VFKGKVIKAISKIDDLLSNKSLTEESKYLLLKIKKGFIKFIYLNNI
jgi:hypothetical protein